jgi:hypothetical protein
MGVLMIAGLTLFLLAFTISVCVQVIRIEKSFNELAMLIEHKVNKLYGSNSI